MLEKSRRCGLCLGSLTALIIVLLSSNMSSWLLQTHVYKQGDKDNVHRSSIDNLIPQMIPINITVKAHKAESSETQTILSLNMDHFHMTVNTNLSVRSNPSMNSSPITWPPRVALSAFTNILSSQQLNLSAIKEVVQATMLLPYSSCKSLYTEEIFMRYVFSNVFGKCDGYGRLDISLLLQMDRHQKEYFEKLSQIALNWRGPISTVVYYGLINASITPSRDYFVNDVKQLLTRYDILSSTLCVHVVFLGQDSTLFPVNLLRNVGMQFAPTDTVLLSEADFIPQPALDMVIRKYVTPEELKLKRLHIVPIFGTTNINYTIPVSKKKLITQWDGKETIPITDIKKKFPFGHKAVNYKQFKTADQPYKVKFTPSFEPYYVVNRTQVPYYPEEMLWGNGDKYIHAKLLNALGWEFYVLPDAFMVHTPHGLSARQRKSSMKRCTSSVSNYLEKVAKQLIPKSTTTGS